MPSTSQTSPPKSKKTNVSYTYPGATRPAVDHVNLHFAPRSVVALVGENGAGKSTLDEPTSALDPLAEHELFQHCAQNAQRLAQSTGGITILVSHRFSTVRLANQIVVLDDGQNKEHGTHRELITQNGLDAELYSLQARQYTGEHEVPDPTQRPL